MYELCRYRTARILTTAVICAAGAGCATVDPLMARSTEPSQHAREAKATIAAFKEQYTKHEYHIPMRDGVKLFTSVYVPRNTSRPHPLLMLRTPYSVSPYGEDDYSDLMAAVARISKYGYILVAQDVRGRFMSEGTFVNMTPHIDNKVSKSQIDESSDTYDTIEWLLANVANHNGKVGMWGISYPGFYTAAGMIDSHPALKAVSPQAPIADWFFDDFHHNGAFFLPHGFNFAAVFGRARPEPTKEWGEPFKHGTPDGYQFFLDMGPLKNANDKYLKGENPMWNNIVAHPNYDEFWQSRNILPHLNNVSSAVLTVGGWYDAEDLYGPLKIYKETEKRNPHTFNTLVMGPWAHGGWTRGDGKSLGHVQFGSESSRFFQENILIPFFEHYLRDGEYHGLPEAYMFETGANRWRKFDQWPPPKIEQKTLYLHPNGGLSFDAPPAQEEEYDEYTSDPAKPVPFTESISIGMTRNYMTDDQRFAGRRPDVLTYRTDVLEEDVTIAGPIQADLWVSTSGTASDWVVKLIDVYPDDAPDYEGIPSRMRMGGYQAMIRSEVIRGRFRNSFEFPEPFEPNKPTRVPLELLDVLHTFKKGHRIMVQIQSTWFPLVDRNPQMYVDNIFLADESNFRKATQRVYRFGDRATRLRVGVLPADDGHPSD